MIFKSIVFVSFISTSFLAETISQLKNTKGHEIIDGNCSSPPYDDRVYYDHVAKTGWPLIIRSETINYYGDKKIYCIQALNHKNNETGGTANITDGGVGHNFVVIELESYRGYGLEFYVSIYGKNSSSKAVKEPITEDLSDSI